VVALDALRRRSAGVALAAGGGSGAGSDVALVAEQLVDNALVSAGLMDDARGMVGRVNDLLLKLLDAKAEGLQK